MVNQRGFNLIELMIVIALIGILAAIAYPSYQEFVRKTNRVDTKTQMMDIAGQLQKYKIANFIFFQSNTTTPITLTDIGQSGTLPIAKPFYNVTLTNVTANTWTLTATPIVSSMQLGDGHLVLNHRGERCWTHGSDKGGAACVPTATTNWDGK